MTNTNTASDLAIRLRRADFNRALKDGDLSAIGPILARDAILVAGTDSAVLSGRKAQLLAWKREFAAAERIVYERLPTRIILSSAEPLAFEHGAWRGATAAGRAIASGAYTAKWRRIDGDWMIEAELFLTLA